MKRWLQDVRGATAIEYGLIAALITIALIVGLTQYGTETTAMYGRIRTAVAGAVAPAPAPAP